MGVRSRRMGPFLAVVLAFPSVVFTVLLGVVLVYWLFVLLGAAHINILGDGAADGAFEGAAKGALEGLADGAAHGVTDGVADGAAHAVGDGAADAAADGVADAADAPGGLAEMMAALKLRSAPATVVISLLIVFSWLFSVLAMQGAHAWFPGLAERIAGFAAFFLAPALALPVTSLLVRPLGRVFLPPKSAKHTDLVGKICVVRTGKVTGDFGEAEVADGGAGLVVRVRIDEGGDGLKRGDQAVIVGYDDERREFTVVPLEPEDDDAHEKPAQKRT